MQLVPAALFCAIVAWSVRVQADTDTCLMDALKRADENMTVGELKEACRVQLGIESNTPPGVEPSSYMSEPAKSAIDSRLGLEAALDSNPWVITPHKPNYLLPLTYNSNVNTRPFDFTGKSDSIKHTEVKFQISFKFPVARNLFDKRADLYFAYTNQSFWQLYASNVSSPFRDTIHEPELFLTFKSNREFFGWTNKLNLIGLVHQSNGRELPLSRSWNRVYANSVFERGNWVFSVRPWYRIPEDEKTDPTSTDGDDNPDIYKYIGYGEFRLLYNRNNQILSFMSRNNLTSEGRGAVELNYSFPLYGKLRGYMQYFYGYGESLIDYDARTNRVGVGIAISDWL